MRNIRRQSSELPSRDDCVSGQLSHCTLILGHRPTKPSQRHLPSFLAFTCRKFKTSTCRAASTAQSHLECLQPCDGQRTNHGPSMRNYHPTASTSSGPRVLIATIPCTIWKECMSSRGVYRKPHMEQLNYDLSGVPHSHTPP